MNSLLEEINNQVYKKLGFVISYFTEEQESKEYDACKFDLNRLHVLSRTAKITPKKVGQFVTFWQRNNNGVIAPYDEIDDVDFFIVNVELDNRLGQFVFPKSILIKKGILTTNTKEGKRAFRVYPNWDLPKSKQAEKTQKWQLDYFYEIDKSTDLEKVDALYKNC